MKSLFIIAVVFIFCLLKLSIFDIEQRATASIYWIEFYQKSIATVRSSLAYVTMMCDFAEKFGIDTQEGIRPQKKIPQGGHWTILDNTEQYYAMLDNIRKCQQYWTIN